MPTNSTFGVVSNVQQVGSGNGTINRAKRKTVIVPDANGNQVKIPINIIPMASNKSTTQRRAGYPRKLKS